MRGDSLVGLNSSTGRYSMGCASPHLMDYIDHADMTWFANEDARDNLSLLRLLFEALSAYWSLFWAFILLMN